MTTTTIDTILDRYLAAIEEHRPAEIIWVWQCYNPDEMYLEEHPSVEQIVVRWLEDGFYQEAGFLILYLAANSHGSCNHIFTTYDGDGQLVAEWGVDDLLAGPGTEASWMVPYTLVAWSVLKMDREEVWKRYVLPGHAEPYLEAYLFSIVRLSVDQPAWQRALIRRRPELALAVYRHHPHPTAKLGRLAIRRLSGGQVREMMVYLLGRGDGGEWELLRYHRRCHPEAWAPLDEAC